jgi:hypothetical protein
MLKKVMSSLICLLIAAGSVMGELNTQNSLAVNSIAPADNTKAVIDEIIRVVGLKPNFEVKAANIPNAAAVAYSGKRYILYNPQFIISLNKAAGNNWASISVLAHEIGHHLNGHTMENIGSQPDKELEADEFSGFVLRRMGASLDEAQSAMRVAASYKPSVTHPGKADRMVAIADGWNSADNQIAGRPDVAKKTRPAVAQSAPSVNRSATSGQAISSENIVGEVAFHADQSGTYYVTKRLNLVKVANNQLYLVGKVARLENAGFPYMIYDDNKTVLLVDTKGNIYSKAGTSVGVLRAHRNS